ncbi:MAG: hypothetical protein WCJ64_00625 [Rhodospirillaceae bacterium]
MALDKDWLDQLDAQIGDGEAAQRAMSAQLLERLLARTPEGQRIAAANADVMATLVDSDKRQLLAAIGQGPAVAAGPDPENSAMWRDELLARPATARRAAMAMPEVVANLTAADVALIAASFAAETAWGERTVINPGTGNAGQGQGEPEPAKKASWAAGFRSDTAKPTTAATSAGGDTKGDGIFRIEEAPRSNLPAVQTVAKHDTRTPEERAADEALEREVKARGGKRQVMGPPPPRVIDVRKWKAIEWFTWAKWWLPRNPAVLVVAYLVAWEVWDVIKFGPAFFWYQVNWVVFFWNIPSELVHAILGTGAWAPAAVPAR